MGTSVLSRVIHALGFSRLKRRLLRLCFPGCEVRFVSKLHEVPVGATVAVWGMRSVP